MDFFRVGSILVCLFVACSSVEASPPPIEAFAALPQMRSPALSPGGTHVVFITSIEDRSIAAVGKIGDPNSLVPLLESQPGKYDLEWCRWANASRILCGVSMPSIDARGNLIPYSRLIAVDSDGGNFQVLFQNTRAQTSQYQDRILD